MPSATKRRPAGTVSFAGRSVETLIEPFEGYLRQSELRPATVRSYVADVRAFLKWLSTRPVTGFASRQFAAYRDFLVQAAQHSTATMNRRLQALRVYGRFLEQQGETRNNPADQIRLVPNGQGEPALPRVLDSDEVERLTVAVRAGARPSLMKRDYAIIELMLQAGLRVNEVSALALQDIVPTRDGMRLLVRGAAHDHYREVPLNETLARALREYIAVRPPVPDVNLVFVSQRGRPLSMRSIQRLVESYAKAAELDGVCANSLRHTCARNMLAETRAPQLVARWLGHKNVESLNRYRP